MITLNGVNIESLGITLLNGWVNELYAPVSYKKLTYNKSNLIDGVRAITSPLCRKVDTREVSIPIKFNGSLDGLITKLVNGVKDISGSYTGVNELSITKDKITFKLAYTSCDKYSLWGKNEVVVYLHFEELNPTDRA